jgi:hypothetical protein
MTYSSLSHREGREIRRSRRELKSIDDASPTSAGVALSATPSGIEFYGVLSQLSIHPRQY